MKTFPGAERSRYALLETGIEERDRSDGLDEQMLAWRMRRRSSLCPMVANFASGRVPHQRRL